jgi:hypothetical protein
MNSKYDFRRLIFYSLPPEPESFAPPRPTNTQHTHYQSYQGYSADMHGGLPPSVKHMEKQIASQSISKSHQEMNRKHQ